VPWSLFGGAITRHRRRPGGAQRAAIGLVEASVHAETFDLLVTAPLFPLIFVFVLTVIMAAVRLPGHDPGRSATLSSAVCCGADARLVCSSRGAGRAGRLPLMSATDQHGGTDSWEAVSRSYTTSSEPCSTSATAWCRSSTAPPSCFFIASWVRSCLHEQVGREPDAVVGPTTPIASRVPVRVRAEIIGWRTLLLDGVDGRRSEDRAERRDHDEGVRQVTSASRRRRRSRIS